MKKIIMLSITSVVVLVLSVLGILKYCESNSINIGFGPGKGSSGGQTKKGTFYKCEQNEDTMYMVGYFDFSKGTLNKIAQYKMEVNVPDDYIKQHTKDELNAELLEYICGDDKDTSMCGNVQIKWNGNRATMTFGVDLSSSSSNFKIDMTESEFLNKMNQSHTTCKKISKAPIYATVMDPAGTYYNKVKKYYKKYEVKTNTSTNIKSDKKEVRPTTENNVNKYCFDLSAGNNSEGVSFIFYCNKKVINPTINVGIIKKVDDTQIASGQKYLKEKYCDKYHFVNCEYTEIEGGVKLVAECKTNYNGLSQDTVEQLYEEGQSIEKAITTVCK